MAKSISTTAQCIQYEDEIAHVKPTSTHTHFDKNLPISSASFEKQTEIDLEERAAYFADIDTNRKKKQVCVASNIDTLDHSSFT